MLEVEVEVEEDAKRKEKKRQQWQNDCTEQERGNNRTTQSVKGFLHQDNPMALALAT
jgi:hypothetical protein